MNANQGFQPHDAGPGEKEPGEDRQEIVLPAMREGRWWVIAAPQHGVFVHGRTLAALAKSAREAVILQTGAHEPQLRVRPRSAQLDALAEAREQYEKALSEAVRSLRLTRTSWSDIAKACRVRTGEARAALSTSKPDDDASRALNNIEGPQSTDG